MTAPTMTRPQLKAEFSVEQRTEVDVDLVEFFSAITDAKMRAAYFEADLQGCEEWERPWVYIHEWICETAEGIQIHPVPGAREGLGMDIEVDEVGRAKRETYDALVAEVPWLDPDAKPDAEDVKRLPGPYDQPMF